MPHRRRFLLPLLLLLTSTGDQKARTAAHGKVLGEASTSECDACGWAALHAKSVLDSDACVDASSSQAWRDVLAAGCVGQSGCASLVARRGVAMAGVLLDAVADGEDAEERGLAADDFQRLLCSEYAEVCPENHYYASVKSVTFASEASPGMDDVAVYRRGSAQAGDLPYMPTVVVTPGRAETLEQRQGMTFKKGHGWRIMPMVPFACPEHSVGMDPSRCVVDCDDEIRRLRLDDKELLRLIMVAQRNISIVPEQELQAAADTAQRSAGAHTYMATYTHTCTSIHSTYAYTDICIHIQTSSSLFFHIHTDIDIHIHIHI